MLYVVYLKRSAKVHVLTSRQVHDPCKGFCNAEFYKGNVTQDFLLAQFSKWKRKALSLIRHPKMDPFGNASTLLKPGDLDVIEQCVHEWKPAPLFLLFSCYNSANMTLLAAALLDFQVYSSFQEDCQLHRGYTEITSFVVSPFMFGKGIGTFFVNHIIEQEKRQASCIGIILFSEYSALGFWTKFGFRKCEESMAAFSTCDNVKEMRLDFYS